MSNLSWRDAIIKVLQTAREPMHYTDIAERVAELELRSDFGATPATSVSTSAHSTTAHESATFKGRSG
jgi:hypothetical protein